MIAPVPKGGAVEDQGVDGEADENAPEDLVESHLITYGVLLYSDVCTVLLRATPAMTINYLQSRLPIVAIPLIP
ncbi:hypothetical protein CE139_19065 [Pseudomonas oryzihabitans]|uniref:Uncharacterized protein n=1 Tax=Pseudomonas oryzihabitans TaxID=47885 RepID=A0A2Z5AES5_9PSED|nr:hypothetical protein CE139_19065 [Pseudomonas oryzihabitans]